jgi:hypothetical protein
MRISAIICRILIFNPHHRCQRHTQRYQRFSCRFGLNPLLETSPLQGLLVHPLPWTHTSRPQVDFSVPPRLPRDDKPPPMLIKTKPEPPPRKEPVRGPSPPWFCDMSDSAGDGSYARRIPGARGPEHGYTVSGSGKEAMFPRGYRGQPRSLYLAHGLWQ